MVLVQVPARKTLFNDATFSDIKILQIYNGRTKEYHAHKAVLCGHSGWFMKALTGPFMEASDPTIEIHDDNPEDFEAMLRYLYTMHYEPDEDILYVDRGFFTPSGLYILADKYNVDGLAMRALETFGYDDDVLLSDEHCEKVIEAYYSVCMIVNSAMGKAIAGYLLRHSMAFMKGYAFGKIICKYPVVGADILLAEKRMECLGKCNRPHKGR
ncbi:uncharacterized protein K460DRAFT_429052 [Cucurbitaria berberidis CBS 394.84]|uniref:BTB domain-containing protein n=1 Tax=Cucurbitaria berberidis CBS 394.84 TaxID=1168544 RepID=A0A9P4GN60_9PLEO|nr:uncharacterized protein K460DRAFT_429052 [Cucurbitaria berberidis CBS 394.84]KAF1849528.1 hypothetical protein K460DRAFT_429052 [Cucurbitaria berberidis CBS 394.84]